MDNTVFIRLWKNNKYNILWYLIINNLNLYKKQ